MAPTSTVVQGLEESKRSSLDVGAVMLSHDWLDGFGGLIGVVEWDGADVVVEDVGLDDAVEEMTADESKFTIDGCGGSTDVVPALTRVVRKCWVGVLKEGDCNYISLVFNKESRICEIHTEPVVNPEIWNKIPDKHVVESVGLAKLIQGGGSDGNTEITQQNKFGILGFIKRTGWRKMADTLKVTVGFSLATTLRLLLVVVVTSDVSEKVQWPSEKLLKNGMGQGSDWGLLR